VNGHAQPYDRIVQALRDRGCLQARGCYVRLDKTRAVCPIHRDVKPSLCVTWDVRGVGLYCHSCHGGSEKIVAALGLKMADLCAARRMGTESRLPATVAIYPYADLNGVAIAMKVRQEPKGFKWCRPDPSGKDGVSWNLKGVHPGLYRWRDLIDCDVVYLTEGEKSADVLWGLGQPATCGPWGAGRWDEQLSMDLYTTGCRELVILPDHDQAGAEHAELVAKITHALEVDTAIVIKVVLAPDLARKQNAVDWLVDGGRSEAELLAIVAQTSVWTPGATERRRLDRRRQQSRDLMRRLRATRRLAVDTGPDIRLLTRPMSDIHPLTVSALAVSAVHALQVHSKVLVSRDPGTPVVVPRDDLGTVVVPLGHDLRPDEPRHLPQRDFVAPTPPQDREVLQGVTAREDTSALKARQASARASEPGEWDISSDVLWNEKETTRADRPLSAGSNKRKGAR